MRDFIFKVVANSLKMIQYTGLTDKNGKYIFEGDLLKEYSVIVGIGDEPVDLIGEVYWCAKDAAYYVNFKDIEQISTISSTMEIIGNIYENADLLCE